MQPRTNIAARAAEWSATHRKTAIFGWLAFVVVSLVIGATVGQKQLTDAEAISGEAGRAEVALERSNLTSNGESVLIQSRDRSVDAPGFQAAIADVTRSVSAVPAVSKVSSPRSGGGQVSADGHSALVEFQLPRDDEVAEAKVDASLAAVAAAQRRHPDMRIEEFGDASANKALEAVFSDDLSKAGDDLAAGHPDRSSLLAFGALVAALVPLLLAFSAVLATIGLLALPSQLVPMDPNVSAGRRPRRARGRRRLLVVLPAARARGAAGRHGRRRRPWPRRRRPRVGPSSSPG